MKEFYCNFCNKSLSLKNYQSFGSHKINCAYNPNKQKIIEKIKTSLSFRKITIEKICLKCGNKFFVERKLNPNGEQRIVKKEKQFCSRKCANSHIVTNLTKKKISITLKSIPKKLSIKKVSLCSQCNKQISSNNNSGLCKQCYNKSGLHAQLMKGKSGGFRKTGGRGKYGTYKGYFYQSSWELAWIIYNLDHCISFQRNRKGFEYFYNDEIHKYYPDFILENATYVEIKGYYSKQWEAKAQQFKEKLIVLDKYSIKPYLQYVEKTYGKDYLKK